MSFRIIICGLIILLSYAGGVLYTWRFTGRLLILKDAKLKFNSMEREVLFSQNTLPAICESLSQENGSFAAVFVRICERLVSENESFSSIWSDVIEEEYKNSSLKHEQVAALAAMGRGLGDGDLNEQKKCFDRINYDLDRMLEEATDERKRLKKMYMSLFMFGGVGLSIVLI